MPVDPTPEERMTTRAKVDKALADVGLPSRQRYNIFVSYAVDCTKIGPQSHPGQGMIWATLALAEATYLAAD